LGYNCVCERAVDRLVPVTPRLVEFAIDHRAERGPPERVLNEPEHRVRDDVVVEVVRARVVRDQHDVSASFGRDDAVFVRRRARDPGHVVLLAQPTQRGDEPAGAASLDTRPVRLAVIGHRAAIGDDDQWPLFRQW
jgi:hypothetical protein